jgi:hypothetical protein
MILMLPLISCTTLQVKNSAIVPDPIVNDESVVLYNAETDEVTMPLWYWKKIVRFIIDSQD